MQLSISERQIAHHVEESKVLLLLDYIRQLTPLRFGGVNTGRVLSMLVLATDLMMGSSRTYVSTSMQEDLMISLRLPLGK